MVSTYGRRGPSAPLVMAAAIALVLTCILIWSFAFRFLQSNAISAEDSTRAADATQQANALPTFSFGGTSTPVPECQEFEVSVESAVIRTCPSTTCESRGRRKFEFPMCVYGIPTPDELYPEADDWYIVDINPDGAFRDLAYMHQSVLQPQNPTPRPSQTFTPLPTVTLTPIPSRTLLPPTPVETATPPPSEL